MRNDIFAPAVFVMKYFAYGSNLCSQRLQKRTPSARFLNRAQLIGYQLRFHKISRNDCSSKCNAWYTGNPTDIVWGAIFDIDSADVPALDKAEDEGVSYDKFQVEVRIPDSETTDKVVIYLARSNMIQEGVKPFEWYKRYVLIGAKQCKLPSEYIETIETVKSVEDPNDKRRSKHLTVQCEIG